MPDGSRGAPVVKSGSDGAWQELFGLRYIGTLTVLCFGVWLHAADSLLVATLMPSTVRDIGGAAFISWTLALYELGSIVAAAATGLMVMRTGLRKVMAGAAVVYIAGCVFSAMAPDMAVMLAGRVLQGVGGGMMLAGTFVGMNRLFPERLWIRVVASVSAVWGTSALVGPLIGGLFASWGMWRGGFWAFGAQGVLFAIAAFVMLKDQAESDAVAPASVPWSRLVLLTFSVVAISAAGAHVTPVGTPLLCLAGVGALVLLLRQDARSSNRMFSVRPWSLSHAPGAGTVMVLVSAFSTISFTIYGPVLMQLLYGADPLTAGFYIAVESVSWSLAAIAVSGVRQGTERPVILAGSALITIGVAGLALAMPLGPMVALLPFAVCLGAGFGMAWGFVVRRTIAAAPPEERDSISSSMVTVQMIGYAIGAAVAGIAANASGFAHGLTLESARTVAVWVFAAFIPTALIGNLAAWKLVTNGARKNR